MAPGSGSTAAAEHVKHTQQNQEEEAFFSFNHDIKYSFMATCIFVEINGFHIFLSSIQHRLDILTSV